MDQPFQPVLTLQQLPLEPFTHGEHYASHDAGLSEKLRLSKLGAAYTEVPPGKSACPFHVHHAEDELFLILEGSGIYRFGENQYPIQAGDVLGAPCGGPEYAHKITNTGDRPLRYLAISSKADIEVCEYPDSGKFLVSSRHAGGQHHSLRFIGRQGDSADYWEGEDTPL